MPRPMQLSPEEMESITDADENILDWCQMDETQASYQYHLETEDNQ